MLTHDEFEFGITNEKIDEILVKKFKGKEKLTLIDIKEAFIELIAQCGLFGLNSRGEPQRAGWIDLYHEQLCFSYCVNPGEIRSLMLKPGQTVDLYVDGSKVQSVKVIVNDDEESKMRFKLDISDDCAVIGSRAAMSAMLPGSEHLQLDENGVIVSNLLTKGESKNEENDD
ncbi:MAG: hypothetical protein E7198_10810 [Schwartzia succinivorans]|uniref:hypothetical protein n=1 Tax=Schwartzia succinivorans TaxID=55507 RepID=UPI002355C6FE|nr:hypothetical protein [Schwartzia succinivorans]MBE6098257.1 hypothetical protein [Schwartzia succinivorans]